MLGTIEREIDQPIVDEVDRLSVVGQPSVLPDQLTGIGDDRLDSLFREKAPRQEKLRIEILRLRRVVADRDPARSACPPLQRPLMQEHAQDGLVERVGA